MAYETSDGVYLAVEEVEGYGLLAQQDLRQLRTTERVDEGRQEEKRNPLDFVLWKLAKPGEPTWPSPWGDGRPGWHTECVAMSLDLLGDGFDLHTGGLDLKFPHHENERAHAVVLGRPFARHWMHHAFVVDTAGEKMSKSLGNFTSLTDLLERVDHRAYRLLLLQAHYRSPVLVDTDSVGVIERSLGTLDRLARRAIEAGLDPEAPLDRPALDPWVAAMEDDLNTVRAMALVFDWVRQANAALDAGQADEAARLVRLVRGDRRRRPRPRGHGRGGRPCRPRPGHRPRQGQGGQGLGSRRPPARRAGVARLDGRGHAPGHPPPPLIQAGAARHVTVR